MSVWHKELVEHLWVDEDLPKTNKVMVSFENPLKDLFSC